MLAHLSEEEYMYQVKKRDGSIAPFDISKIKIAMIKAFDASNRNYHSDIIDMMAVRVTSVFQDKIVDDLISVEDIQALSTVSQFAFFLS